MSPGSSNDKTEAVPAPDKRSSKRLSFFSRRENNENDGIDDDTTKVNVSPSKSVAPVTLKQLFRFTTPFELCLDFIGLIAAVAAGAAQPLMTLIFGNLVQSFVRFGIILSEVKSGSTTAQEQLPAAAAAFRHDAAKDAAILVYIGVGVFVCTFAYMEIWVSNGEASSKRLRESYLQAVLRQDIAFFDNVGAGEVATRIQTDTHLVQQGTSEKMATCFYFISGFFAGFILAYTRSWRLALAMSSILPCIGVIGTVMNKFVSKYLLLSRQYVSDSGSLAEEVISTIRTAQAFGTQKALASIYDTHVIKAGKVDNKSAVLRGGGLAFCFFVIYAAYGLAFSFGTTLINEGHATAGEVINVFMAILIGSFSLAQLAPEMQAVTDACGAAAKLYETIDRIPDIDSSDPGGLKLEKVEGHITFEGVAFNYPSRPHVPVVKGLSISFPAGKTAALVGASGSGKSTVVSLVERFYDPLSGVVKLDGVDVKELNIKWLRSQIGLVSQEPTLFATTIKENVAHGLIGTEYEHATEEQKFALIQEACVKANADSFINNMPLGYDTLVGERGFLMSGGQKQRIAIARAIVSDPRILLLDEATSALDTQSEGIVQDALDKAAAGRTTITIAHRLSTIMDASHIFVMGDGLVLEQGTHSELLSDENGPYSRLVAAQHLREEREVDSDSVITVDGEDTEKRIQNEMPRGAKNSAHSLASDIIAQKKLLQGGNKNGDDYSLTYLFMRMGKLNQASWRNYGLGVVAASLSGMVHPAMGILYATGINGFSDLDPRQRRRDGDRTALYYFVIAIISTCTLGLQNYFFSSAAASLTARVRSLSFKAILRQDVEFFDKEENSSGGLTGSLSDNAQKISGLAGITLGTIVQSLSTVIAGLILGFVFIWKIGLVAMACMPAVLSTGYIRLRVIVLKDQTDKKAHEESAQIACEAAGAIRTVASLTREDDCSKIYSRSLEEPLRRSNQSAIWSNVLFAISQSVTLFVIALVFWYGARLVSFLEFSNFDFFVALLSSVFGAIQAGNIFSYVPDISSAKGASSDVIKLLDSRPEIDAESTEGKKVSADTVRGQIRFENIHFRYPTRPGVRVLRDLSLKIEPGTYIALVGASGSGKSTVIQLIERFYDPLAGKIYLDDQPISELNIQEYRKQIALVSQEPTLYAGTIRFNVLLGAIKPESEVTQEEIEQACRNANILDFINSLPEGFDTEVGGKGSQLSGGQKQRIAIARALLRNPKVLLLDEATSALDSTSEKVVQDALDKAARGRTTIAIAHRLSTIQNADCIYFVKDGAVSEYGTHDELLRKQGHYYEYVQLQGLNRMSYRMSYRPS